MNKLIETKQFKTSLTKSAALTWDIWNMNKYVCFFLSKFSILAREFQCIEKHFFPGLCLIVVSLTPCQPKVYSIVYPLITSILYKFWTNFLKIINVFSYRILIQSVGDLIYIQVFVKPKIVGLYIQNTRNKDFKRWLRVRKISLGRLICRILDYNLVV